MIVSGTAVVKSGEPDKVIKLLRSAVDLQIQKRKAAAAE
jgi:hypothetical protein